MTVGYAGDWDREDIFTFRESLSGNGEGACLPIEHLR